MEATSSVIEALSRHEGEFLRRFGATPARAHVLNRLLACRTGALGGHLLVCGRCKLELRVYKSCDDRHCPQCGTARATKWLEQRLGRMLAVPHFQVVFMLPAQLRAVAHDNPTFVYALMFRVGASVLADLAEQRLDARLGITSVLHTWVSNLSLHTASTYALSRHRWSPCSTVWRRLEPERVTLKAYFPA